MVEKRGKVRRGAKAASSTSSILRKGKSWTSSDDEEDFAPDIYDVRKQEELLQQFAREKGRKGVQGHQEDRKEDDNKGSPNKKQRRHRKKRAGFSGEEEEEEEVEEEGMEEGEEEERRQSPKRGSPTASIFNNFTFMSNRDIPPVSASASISSASTSRSATSPSIESCFVCKMSLRKLKRKEREIHVNSCLDQQTLLTKSVKTSATTKATNPPCSPVLTRSKFFPSPAKVAPPFVKGSLAKRRVSRSKSGEQDGDLQLALAVSASIAEYNSPVSSGSESSPRDLAGFRLSRQSNLIAEREKFLNQAVNQLFPENSKDKQKVKNSGGDGKKEHVDRDGKEEKDEEDERHESTPRFADSDLAKRAKYQKKNPAHATRGVSLWKLSADPLQGVTPSQSIYTTNFLKQKQKHPSSLTNQSVATKYIEQEKKPKDRKGEQEQVRSQSKHSPQKALLSSPQRKEEGESEASGEEKEEVEKKSKADGSEEEEEEETEETDHNAEEGTRGQVEGNEGEDNDDDHDEDYLQELAELAQKPSQEPSSSQSDSTTLLTPGTVLLPSPSQYLLRID